MLLQAFVGVITVTTLVLAAVTAEREDSLLREHAARAEAEQSNSAKDQFLAVLSHELRTPLTPVLLTASLLENDRQLPDRFRADLKMIRDNIELEARLIDDLLDLTRIRRGKLRFTLETADIQKLIRHAVEICSGHDGRTVAMNFAARHHHISADPGRIQQVFWNLVNNAMKFTPVGGTITISTVNTDDGSIVVRVTDTGIGIAPELLPRLFTAFEQGGTARSGNPGGLGLGLAISKALVTAHGGTLTASSGGHGKGATFTVELPTLSESELPAAMKEGGAPSPRTSARPLNILLVEDHQTTLAALRRLLSAQRHTIIGATTIAAAMEAAESSKFDLIISDLGLPDGVGYDLMRMIREKYGIKGIALSGFGMEADIQRSLEAGFMEHLTKPVDLGRLEAAIQRVASS